MLLLQTAVANSGTDYVGFHLPLLDNEPFFSNENPQQFKGNYIGRLIIASENSNRSKS